MNDRPPVDLQRMMDDQSRLQVAMGNSHPATRSPEAQMEYVREMTLAAVSELMEALDETGWRTWSSSNHVNRDAFIGEIRDAQQFIFNMLSLVECTAEEFCGKLAEKHRINWERLANGYTGLNKCPECKRALDDPTTRCSPTACAHVASVVDLS